jgi:hypothetical protein
VTTSKRTRIATARSGTKRNSSSPTVAELYDPSMPGQLDPPLSERDHMEGPADARLTRHGGSFDAGSLIEALEAPTAGTTPR